MWRKKARTYINAVQKFFNKENEARWKRFSNCVFELILRVSKLLELLKLGNNPRSMFVKLSELLCTIATYENLEIYIHLLIVTRNV